MESDPFSKTSGFSMVELVVIVAILGVLAAVSVPMINNYMPTYHLKKAARDIVSQMQLARIHAIQNRVRTVAVFTPATFIPAGQAGSFYVFEDDNRNGTVDATDNNWIQDAGESTVVPSTVMPRHVTLISASFTNNGSGQPDATRCFGFDSGGVAARIGVNYMTGSVRLQNRKNETRTISFYASGKTKITTP